MKLMWLGYLVYSLDNHAMKLCIETGLINIKGAINYMDTLRFRDFSSMKVKQTNKLA
jgi:hypothetical protein